MISGDELEYSGIKASAFNHSATLHLVMFLIEIYSLHVGQADLIFFLKWHVIPKVACYISKHTLMDRLLKSPFTFSLLKIRKITMLLQFIYLYFQKNKEYLAMRQTKYINQHNSDQCLSYCFASRLLSKPVFSSGRLISPLCWPGFIKANSRMQARRQFSAGVTLYF